MPDYPIKRYRQKPPVDPFGYVPSPDDPKVYLPIPEVWDRMEEAFLALDNNTSLMQVAAWVTDKTGHRISHEGLRKLWSESRRNMTTPRHLRKQELARKRKPLAKKRQKEAYKKKIVTTELNRRKKAERKIAVPKEDEGTTVSAPAVIPVHEKDVGEVIFRPNPGPQTEFLAATEQEVLVGGAAGGSKTYSLIADPLRYFGHAQFNGLLIRRTTDELREIVWKTQELYPRAYPGAKWSERKNQWIFPSGARHWLTYLERDEDVLRYQGQSFCLPKGSPIFMADGTYKPIEQVRPGDLVHTLEGPKPVTKLWPVQVRRLVRVRLYYSSGALACEQLLPDNHPIACVASGTSLSFPGSYHIDEQLPQSPLQWRSYRHLLHDHRGSQETHASVEDGQTDYTRFEDVHLEASQLPKLYVPLVLHEPALLSDGCGMRFSTQSHTSGRSSQPYSEKRTDTEISSTRSGLPQPAESSQYRTDYSTEHLPDAYSRARSSSGKVEGFPIDYRTCPHSHDGQSLPDREFDRVPFPLLDDAEAPFRIYQRVDETDCTPSHTPYPLERYAHPYTQEQREPSVRAGLLLTEFQPLDTFSYCYDITVAEANHYVGIKGIIHKNCHISIDELTQYSTPFAWNYLRSRLRTTAPDLPVYQRASSNPGGPGHLWVKKMFIDPAPPGKSFPATDLDTGKPLLYPPGHPKEGQPLFYRRFIPAKLSDNPYLANSTYEASLLSLPENLRRQLLEGDWSVTDGAAFSEFRPSVHTCEPFEIPYDWKRFRSCDFGYSSHSAVHWYAIDPAYETLYVYRELYVHQMTARQLAMLVKQSEEGERIAYGVLDSSCWHQRGQTGPSIAEEMISAGTRWRPSDRSPRSRVAGKMRLHELLQEKEYPDDVKRPGIVFFNTCRQIIADLPVIPADPKGSDDIDIRYASDHAYDSIRYGIMSRPRPYDPFDLDSSKSAASLWMPSDPTFGY